jgi:hypothetical protein
VRKNILNYTTLSRRAACLDVGISSRLNRNEKLNISVDSTGLKVYGEGEWKVRKQGVSKRKTWTKLHVGLDVDTNEFVTVLLTDNSVDEAILFINKYSREKWKEV